MIVLVRLLMLAMCFFILSNCSSFSSTLEMKKKEYLSARSIPPLKIPPGLKSDAFENRYPVSNRTYPESSKDISLVPPGL